MKKRNILILLIISMLFCISSVKAKQFTCGYEYPGGGKVAWADEFELTFKLNDDNTYNSYSSKVTNDSGYNSPIIIDFDVEDSMVLKYINEKLVNNGDYMCPKEVYACDTSKGDDEDNYATYVFVALTMDGYSHMYTNKKQDPGDPDLEIPIKHNGEKYVLDACIFYDYKPDKDNDWPTVDFDSMDCSNYINKVSKLKTLYNDKDYLKYNEKKDELITFCQNVISNVKYEIKEGMVDGCYSSCLKINDDFAKIENSSGGKRTCGFSQRLIVWAANIVKWIKYIIPVIVIVLGIIDFIKAIASSSDDEMKKAQGRFIKRLVAAALIFIIPFIIEFILDKTGFSEYVSGCGVIDL